MEQKIERSLTLTSEASASTYPKSAQVGS